MVTLSEPSRELATRFVSKVAFEERIVGARMTPMAGVLQRPIHGIEEAANFLQIETLEEVSAAGPRASIPYIDPKRLKEWVEDVFGDTELAQAMGVAIDEGTNYVDTVKPIKELMDQRLEQCKAVLRQNSSN